MKIGERNKEYRARMNPLVGAPRTDGRSGGAVGTTTTTTTSIRATTDSSEGGRMTLTKPTVKKRIKRVLERWPHTSVNNLGGLGQTPSCPREDIVVRKVNKMKRNVEMATNNTESKGAKEKVEDQPGIGINTRKESNNTGE